MQLLSYAWLMLGCAGHIALWVALFNRNHALGLPRPVLQAMEKLHILMMVSVPVLWLYRLAADSFPDHPVAHLFADRRWEGRYFFVCCGCLVYIAARWTMRRLNDRPPAALLRSRYELYDVSQLQQEPLVAGFTTHLLSRIPGNEITKLCVNEKTLVVNALHARHEGLTIAHLSDLHFTGKLTRAYFDFVIDRVNQLEADIVVVTGDIVDFDRCVDWIPETLGKLRSRYGKYFVLGNHDKRVRNIGGLRQTMIQAGFIDLGGRVERPIIAGCELLLAGNERPWFGPAPTVPPRSFDAQGHPVMRILLSHSPDQIPWARRHDFDLMLAGHTHGGQIRFPIIGPVVAPSLFGVKYASGVFDEAPTLVHVSRGVSGLDPIRINCLPEVTKIVLRSTLVDPAPVRKTTANQIILAEQPC